MLVNVYSKYGEKVNEFKLKQPAVYISGRISKVENKKSIYYKGAGLRYTNHFSSSVDKVKVLRKINDLYFKAWVENPCFVGKFGVFQERYHPVFSEWMGACGARELDLMNNSKEFERSDITVLDYIEIDSRDNGQGYYEVIYLSERISYLEAGSAMDLLSLIEYMLNTGWNFPWDKDSISDISYKGNITDVADLFKSKEITHQLGTLYSLLHSLARRNIDKYIEFIDYINLPEGYTFNMPTLAKIILERHLQYSILDTETQASKNRSDFYVLELLVRGKNWGYGEFKEYGDARKKNL